MDIISLYFKPKSLSILQTYNIKNEYFSLTFKTIGLKMDIEPNFAKYFEN